VVWVTHRRIALTGSTGLLGSAAGSLLSSRGHTVVPLVRRPVAKDEQAVLWLPDQGVLESRELAGCDAVVHLAGENISSRRWNAAQKARIRDSRVLGTRLLVSRILEMETPPKVFITAAAIGFYGDRGDEDLAETAGPGEGFLASVCQEWEQESAPLAERGVRVVRLRFGVILTPKGGALKRMLTPFRLGLGGVVGRGSQWVSWISLDDAAGVIGHALEQDSLHGPVNAVAPEPVTNAQLTRCLGAALRRPTVLPMPAFAARLALGEMADDLLLVSCRVRPRVLQERGFPYQHPDLESALAGLTSSA
jgi:uncharacterized protein (TIGR01777 family)